ncbi:cleavage/polyadenylation specificity factor, 25kDa subunit [Tanacetum coccineum]|uniref:Cleavage/polyadenylation specificity factor, 25kDa subunit n=1 Tax=Tanacetum coccineum TaxID=301880 RepID=A0ABQ4YWU5_9ASTR
MRSCRVDLGGVGGVRGSMGNGRLAGSRRIRVGIWNVGSLTGKFFELLDVLGIHKVDIACFQKTKWRGSSTNEGNGYKLWYSRSSTARNEVAVILASGLKDNVLQVYKSSNRIMAVTLVIDGETVNVISAYTPQVGLSEGVPIKPASNYRGDLNGHTGAAADGYTEVYGCFAYEVRNDEGRSWGRSTQIDYLMVRKGDLKVCKDYRVSPGENLIGDARESFKVTVSKGLSARVEDLTVCDADQMWNTLACTIRDIEKDSLGVTSGSTRTQMTHRESWWFSEDVRTKVAVKHVRITKARERGRRGLGSIRYIKDESGRSIVDEEVGLHQGSAISPYLFTLILDELSRGIQESIHWSMIFADDIKLVAESAEGLNNRLVN